VDSFQRNLGTSANVAKAKEALKAIKGLETRKYVPRKFTELFEGNEMKISSSNIREFGSRKIEPKPVKEAEHYAKEKCYTEEKGYGEEEHCAEEEHMEFIRRDTAFDDKENDWMAFAMQQAEFYKNANQYIVNIRLDIEEIDDAIDDLMEEIEISNCNVTQGYKLFKRLKELRLSRKKKEKELECLYILTEHVDVNAMADECESNVNALEEYLYGKDENMASESEDIHRSSQSKDGSRKEAFAEELKGNEIAEEKFKGNGIEQEELVEKKIG
jgi:hypothetical protein